MSAGYKVAGRIFWGTNGAVEVYLVTLHARAADRFGHDDPLTAFFRDELEGFSMGKIVYLDEWLRDVASRCRLLMLLDEATDTVLREGTFTEYGRRWVASVVGDLRSRIAEDSRT